MRPPALGPTRQGLEYKKGEPGLYPSWRKDLVNTQLGLLMEGLFYDRAAVALRQKLGPAQAGYEHTCKYHLLTRLDIAADRMARGLALLVLLGDLPGRCFPKGLASLASNFGSKAWTARGLHSVQYAGGPGNGGDAGQRGPRGRGVGRGGASKAGLNGPPLGFV